MHSNHQCNYHFLPHPLKILKKSKNITWWAINLYIGESTGINAFIDINIGKIIVNFGKHNSEIITLKYSDKNFMLILLSYDGVIKIHKEIELTKISILKAFSIDSFKIMEIEYSETYSRLIID